MNYNPPVIIFSVNSNRIDEALTYLKEFTNGDFKEVETNDSGIKERAFVVLAKFENFVEKLVSDYGYGEYWHVNNDRVVTLINIAGQGNQKTLIGKLVSINPNELSQNQSYIFDSINQQHYTVEQWTDKFIIKN